MKTLSPRAVIGGLSLLSAALLLGALGFQYIGHLPPCELCHWQRWPHGAVVALGVSAWGWPLLQRHAQFVLSSVGVLLWVGAAIAFFHVGVEQQWWHGTTACGGPISGARTVEELMERISRAPLVRCEDIPWSFWGFSMAAYNAFLSFLGGLLAFLKALSTRKKTIL